jgi:hypothetical protein
VVSTRARSIRSDRPRILESQNRGTSAVVRRARPCGADRPFSCGTDSTRSGHCTISTLNGSNSSRRRGRLAVVFRESIIENLLEGQGSLVQLRKVRDVVLVGFRAIIRKDRPSGTVRAHGMVALLVGCARRVPSQMPARSERRRPPPGPTARSRTECMAIHGHQQHGAGTDRETAPWG